MTVTLQALSLVEKAEPVQVRCFTLRLRGPMEYVNARWMESLHGIEWIVFHGHLDCFPNPPPGGRPTTKSGDHGALNANNC